MKENNNFLPDLVKISLAAKTLGVSIDTLRRWEEEGKIKPIRTPGGTRLYDLKVLSNIKSQGFNTPQPNKIFTTENNLELKANDTNSLIVQEIPPSHTPFSLLHTSPTPSKYTKLLQTKPLIGLGLLLFFFLSVISLSAFNIPSSYLSILPFFNSTSSSNTPYSQLPASSPSVLAAETVKKYLEINSDVGITKSLAVEGEINGIRIIPGTNGFTITAGTASFTVPSGNVTLNQGLSTTSTPTFSSLNASSLNLSSNSSQVVLNSGGITGTISWTPTGAAKTITLPDITDTLVSKTSTDTLTNKTIKSGDSNTISGSFPDITGITSLGTVSTGVWNGDKITAGYGGTGLSSYTKGDLVYSSASTTLAKLNIGTTGQTLVVGSGGIPEWSTVSSTADLSTATGTLAPSSGGTGATTLTGILKGNGTSAFTSLTGTTNYLTKWTDNTTIGSSSIFEDAAGNVGLGTTSPGYNLDVTGSGNFSGSLTVAGNLITAGTVGGSGSTATFDDITLGGKTNLRTDDTNLASGNDVFSYDTSSDIDGGTWVNSDKSQSSSWYNETIDNTGANCNLATNDRCGKRAFPKKAVLVATNSTLYIYDASDNTLWMKFSEGTGYVINGTSIGLNAVFGLNGTIYLATNSIGLLAIDFIHDQIYKYDYNEDSGGKAQFISTISGRNTNKGYATRSSWGEIDSNKVLGIFARVIGGKTYVAASTQNGISVINTADQRVVNYMDQQ